MTHLLMLIAIIIMIIGIMLDDMFRVARER